MPIPSGPEPVYTVAMRGLVVTASGLTKDKKEIIKIKVHWMGGTYNTVLTDETTHLISDTVLSVKYVRSVEIGIPVMSETWVDAVWEAALRLNVSGASSDFNNYRLPPFANLEVTTSGIPKRDKQMIMKLVNQHGGKFSGAFQSETTDVVVLTKEGVGSEKYKAALEYGKVCVLPSWVKDSAEKGVALPVAKYKIVGASTSSPLAEHRLPDMSLNFSRITNLRPPSNFVDETRSADVSTTSGKIKLSQESRKANDTSIDKELQIELDSFDMNDIKKAGPIFDGFCIWLVNLSGRAREVCAAAVSRCGGVRYDAPHARLTHALLASGAGGAGGAAAARDLPPSARLLSPLWLLRSVKAGKPLDETPYLIHTTTSTPVKCARKQPAEASPMSKKNLQLLRREPLDLPPPTVEVEPEDELVNHYLSQAAVENVPLDREKTPERVAPNSTTNEHPDITEDGEDPTEEIEQIFRGIKFVVQGLDEEAIIEIGAEVSAAGGALCGAGAAAGAAGASHALVPLDFDPEELLTAGAEPVTVFWVKDCLSQQELVPIQYYHRPVRLASWSAAPLQGVVASLSTYSGIERAFLDELAKLLGATTQLRFCRRNTANALASTHLICPTPVGDKYTGALKWGLPAVKASWLMACAKEGKRVSERGHLVGDTKAPPSPAKLPEEAKAEGNPIVQPNESVDKENAMLPPQGSALPRRGSVPSADNTPKNTPKAKLGNDGTDEMSPASRYIAMARQGLLGGDSQETPSRLHEVRDDDKIDSAAVRTPPLEDALSTPNLQLLSPTTRRRLQALRRGDLPSDPIRTPRDPFDKNLSTPDSAFGAALRPGSGRLSPDARKRLWRVVNELPSKQEQTPTNVNTPLSEIRNRFLAQFNGDAPSTPSDHHLAPRKLHLLDQEDTPPAKMAKISQDQVGCYIQYAASLPWIKNLGNICHLDSNHFTHYKNPSNWFVLTMFILGSDSIYPVQ
ncbi:DNA topoisomerase 2-binding protein 1-like isoform X2 [Manduca sexta]|nr:DNA topoisomerase 2-binding protein 1-like isoform X2 [Manduca sexta]